MIAVLRRSVFVIFIALVVVAPSTAFSARDVRVYGYFDMEMRVNNKDDAGKLSTFDQHHLNILTTYHLDARFRILTEVEYEHGPTLQASGSFGKIYVPTALIEYKHSDAIKLKAGVFLAPFGIYNERHDATVTFLFTDLPHAIYGKRPNSAGMSERLFAKTGAGVKLFGTLFRGDWEAQYHAYVINGRGPKPTSGDNNANKGVGARLIVRPPVEGLHFGASFYTDRNGNDFHTRHSAVAVDAGLDRARFLVEAEAILPRIENVTAEVPNGIFSTLAAGYVQAAYRVANRVTPFARFGIQDPDTDVGGDQERHAVVGINVLATPVVYLKCEIHSISFESGAATYEKFVASLAAAF